MQKYYFSLKWQYCYFVFYEPKSKTIISALLDDFCVMMTFLECE